MEYTHYFCPHVLQLAVNSPCWLSCSSKPNNGSGRALYTKYSSEFRKRACPLTATTVPLLRRCIGYENKDRKNQRGLMVPAFPDQGLIIQACPDQSHSVNSRPHSNPRAHCRRDYSVSGAAAREFTALCKRSGAKQFKFLSCFPKSSGPCSLVWLRDEGARHIL